MGITVKEQLEVENKLLSQYRKTHPEKG